MHAKSVTADTDVVLVRKGRRRLCVPLWGGGGASKLQTMWYHNPTECWALFTNMPVGEERISPSLITSGVLLV